MPLTTEQARGLREDWATVIAHIASDAHGEYLHASHPRRTMVRALLRAVPRRDEPATLDHLMALEKLAGFVIVTMEWKETLTPGDRRVLASAQRLWTALGALRLPQPTDHPR